MIEFSLLTVVWVPLLLGTMWIGSAMVREQEVTQAARDLASMYARGFDFSTTTGPTNTILSEITQALGTVTSTGTGVVIFSQLTYVGNSVCGSFGPPYGTLVPLAHTGTCKNYGSFVFTQQYVQGNKSLRSSNFGTAPATDLDSANMYKVDNPSTLYLTDANLVSKFSLLPAPQENGTDGYQSGGPIYVVEVYFTGPGQAGFTNGGDYAYAVF